jgi:hypothetical protein
MSFWRDIVERIRSRCEGRTTDEYRLEVGTWDFAVTWRTLENRAGSTVVPWDSIQRIVAFKRDLWSVDRICLAIVLQTGEAVEVDEDMEGWVAFVDALPEHLPGCRIFGEWFEPVASPAFGPNPTTLFERVPDAAIEPSPGADGALRRPVG